MASGTQRPHSCQTDVSIPFYAFKVFPALETSDLMSENSILMTSLMGYLSGSLKLFVKIKTEKQM